MSRPADTAAASIALKDADAVLSALAEGGLLLLSDPKRRNAVEVVTGQFPKGSWWSHPAANRIYDILQEVMSHPDVLTTKLVAGKVTLVHRRLFPALLAVATAREPWQLEGLSSGAQALLQALDDGTWAPTREAPLSRTAVKELEPRLLVRAESEHGKEGRHETRVESWTTWAARVDVTAAASVSESKRLLAEAAATLGPPAAELPFEKRA